MDMNMVNESAVQSLTYTIKYYSRDTGALIAINTDVKKRKARNSVYDYGDYWTTTIEPWPFVKNKHWLP